MINNTVYTNILSWFDNYTQSFVSSDPVEKLASTLKIDHTLLVVKNNAILCDSISIDNELRCLSEIVALLHDIARFEQFKKYRTFSDRHSVNHACLGIQIIEQHDVLKELNNQQQQLVKNAILFHNAASLPKDLDATQRVLCHLIRDSDKLDIYRIVSDYYKNPDATSREIIGIGISEDDTISDEIILAICAKKNIEYSSMKTMNDFKLVQLGWVFDMNFPMSVYLFTQRNHFHDIRSSLPNNHMQMNSAIEIIERHINKVLSEFNPPEFS